MRKFRKVGSFLLIFMMVLNFFSIPEVTQAASYPHITDMIDGEGKDIPYYPQINSGDCGISSIAMIEAEALGYTKASYWFNAFYEATLQANIEKGKSPSFSISKVLSGYKSIKSSNDNTTLLNMYNELKKGNPILVYRTGGKGIHWSVVVAYNGSTSSLQKSGFVVYNTMHDKNPGDVQKTDLASWLSNGATWKYAYVRDEGVMSSVTQNVKTIRLENIHYPINLKTGNTFASTGLLISGSKLTTVEVGVKTKSGTSKFKATRTNVGKNYYGLMNLDSEMKFASKLSAGTYIYYVKAKNEAGNTLSWSKEFTVSSNALTWGKTTYGENLPTKVTLNKTSATITKAGGTVSLTATVTPDDATYKTVTWKSSNAAVATVSSSGVVTAVGNGTATITATTESGGKTATCKVTVSIDPTSVTLDKNSATLKEGESLTLKATVSPSNAVNKNVTWKSDNTNVATVDANGKVTAVGSGTATITVTTTVGNKTAKCVITVEANQPAGWQKNDNGWWYRNSDGSYLKDCWKVISDKWYSFDSRGYMREGWYRDNETWYYLQPNSGHMVSGWQYINNKLYYFTPGGVMAKGWQYIDDTFYYFTSGGALAKGWQYIDNTFYYFTSAGEMVTGWQSIDGEWYYFKGSGEMVTGWVKVGNTWYYMEANGAMATGWINLNGTWYYLYENGAMAADTWIGDYYVNSSGAWVR